MGLLTYLFSVRYMVGESERLGELPTSREGYRAYFRVAWPAVMEYLLFALVTSVDVMMVGVLGKVAITAVGLSNQPRLILLCVVRSMTVGVTTITARRRGQEDQAGANLCLRQSLVLCAILTAVTTGVGLFFTDAIFAYMGGEPAVQQAAKEYFQVVMIGNIFASFTMTINAAQRGVGRTKIAMITNTAANLVNVVFNYFLIEGNWIFPRLGVRGAALATALGHLVALLLALHSLTRPGGFLSLRRGGSWRLEKETVGLIARVSSGALMEQVGTRLGMLLYVKIVNGLGTAAFAAHQICMTFTDILFSLGEGLGVAAAALTGRYLGAGRPDLSKVYSRIGLRFTVVLSAVLCPLIVLCRGPLMRIYSHEADVVALGREVFVVVALTGVFVIANSLYAGALRGAGDVNFVGVSSLIGFFAVRPLVSYLLCYPAGVGLIGAWIGLGVDYVVRFILYYIRFNRGRWTSIRV